MGCCASRPEEDSRATEDSQRDRDDLVESIKKSPPTLPPTPQELKRNRRGKSDTTLNMPNKGIRRGSFVKNLQGSVRQYYQIVKTLGKGTDKEVFIVLDKRTQLKRILKKYPKTKDDFEGYIKFMNQVEILKDLDHPNISKIYESLESSSCYYIISEYLDGGELLQKIIGNSYLNDTMASRCMSDIFNGLNYCHKRGIIHANIKPDNLFFESKATDSRLKIANFDLSSYINEKRRKLKPAIRNMYYMAPEVLEGSYDEKCDIWSAGIVLHIMITGKAPFTGQTKEDIMASMKEGLKLDTTEWTQYPDGVKDLLSKLLIYNPKERISIEQAINHPWIQSNIEKPSGDNPVYLNAMKHLNQFRAKSNFEKYIFTFIASQLLTTEEEKELSDLFQELDTNKDGKLSREELIAGYERSDINTNIEIDAIMKYCDTDGSGSIEFSEFLTAAVDWNKMMSEETLDKAFKLYDISGDGTLNWNEIKHCMPMVSRKELKNFMRMIDTNLDRVITYDEFMDYMQTYLMKQSKLSSSRSL